MALFRVFGARIILTADEIKSVIDLLDDWQEVLGLKNWYLRHKEGYRGLHIYFKNKNNFYFPWGVTNLGYARCSKQH